MRAIGGYLWKALDPGASFRRAKGVPYSGTQVPEESALVEFSGQNAHGESGDPFFCAPERTTANLVRLAGIEPTTLGFGGQYSIH
jgi:hypothetical protein